MKANQMNLTPMELQALALCGGTFSYDNAEDQKADNASYFHMGRMCTQQGLHINVVKGVAGSLVKKGLLAQDDEHPSMPFVTDAGVDAYFEYARPRRRLVEAYIEMLEGIAADAEDPSALQEAMQRVLEAY